MKAAVLTGLRCFSIQEIPEPRIDLASQVLLKVEQVGVCGSDVHYFEMGRIGDQVVEFPWLVGHEFAATVLEVGTEVRGLAVGDRVAVDPAVACGTCDQCRAGRENTCRELKFLACPGQLPGCLCERIVMPAACCYRLADEVTLTHGVLSEPLSVAVHATSQAEVGEGSSVAILGSGPIGLGCLLGSRARGAAACFVTDEIEARLSHARSNGATWTGNPREEDVVRSVRELAPLGVDVVFECAGEQETLDQAVHLLRPGRTLAVIGIPRTNQVAIDIHEMRRQEIRLLNIRRQNRCVQTTLDWLAARRIDPDSLVTHSFPLERVQEAFELVAGYRDGVVKAIIQL